MSFLIHPHQRNMKLAKSVWMKGQTVKAKRFSDLIRLVLKWINTILLYSFCRVSGCLGQEQNFTSVQILMIRKLQRRKVTYCAKALVTSSSYNLCDLCLNSYWQLAIFCNTCYNLLKDFKTEINQIVLATPLSFMYNWVYMTNLQQAASYVSLRDTRAFSKFLFSVVVKRSIAARPGQSVQFFLNTLHSSYLQIGCYTAPQVISQMQNCFYFTGSSALPLILITRDGNKLYTMFELRPRCFHVDNKCRHPCEQRDNFQVRSTFAG